MSENIEKLKRAMRGLYLIAEEDVARDINSRINNVMSDYVKEVAQLQAELAKKDEQLKEANEVIRFYGNKSTWMYSSGSSRNNNSEICKDMDCSSFTHEGRGGKRAREYKKKWGIRDVS